MFVWSLYLLFIVYIIRRRQKNLFPVMIFLLY
ncbi:hypothetical protein BOQ62_20200 [Chryseobacterium sp. CH21]|nr:hypothetical protein DBR28_19020 [Chryseobacterium sp. HMWF028]RXM38008.1 hypothetical protein BOQ62_20200 [Chryseobacterium sp. CH21]